MSEEKTPEDGKAPHVPTKMRGTNRGDLETVLKYHDQSTLDTSWIRTINGAGEVKDKKKKEYPTDSTPSNSAAFLTKN